MTQTIGVSYSVPYKAGFKRKSLAGHIADFRAQAGALGRQDIIKAFNEHPSLHGSYQTRLSFVIKVKTCLWRDPDAALHYLTVRGRLPDFKLSNKNFYNVTKAKAGRRRDGERPQVAEALKLEDPCA